MTALPHRPAALPALVTAMLLVTLAPSVARAALTPTQAKFVATVDARLKQAETNLKSAQDAAGPADQKPAASRANLAMSRAASARGQVQTVTDAVKQLPADDPAVKALADRAAVATKALDELEARLTGKAGPAAPPAAAGGGMKLDYKQEKLLKDAQFYLGEIEGTGENLAALAAQTAKAPEPEAFDHRAVAGGIASIEKMRARKKIIDGYFAQLPKDGAGVAATTAELGKWMARVEDAAKVLEPLHAKLQKVVDPAAYPQLKEDLARVQGLGQMLNPDVFRQPDPARAAAVAAQAGPGREEHDRVVKAYRLLIAQQTDDGERIGKATQYLAERLKAFDEAAAAKRTALPGEIKADLDEANRRADQGVKEQKAAFFGPQGGVYQPLSHAEERVALLAVLDADAAKVATQSVAQTRASIRQKGAALRQQIVAENPLPPDRYTGRDKQALADLAVAAWKKAQPDAQVLAVRIPSEKWEREAMWRYQNRTWYLIDRSRLQAQVIVKLDDKLAAVRPINLWTDHVDGDKLSAIPMEDDPKREVDPTLLLLAEKVK